MYLATIFAHKKVILDHSLVDGVRALGRAVIALRTTRKRMRKSQSEVHGSAGSSPRSRGKKTKNDMRSNEMR